MRFPWTGGSCAASQFPVFSFEASRPRTLFLFLGSWLVFQVFLLSAVILSRRVGCSSSTLSVPSWTTLTCPGFGVCGSPCPCVLPLMELVCSWPPTLKNLLRSLWRCLGKLAPASCGGTFSLTVRCSAVSWSPCGCAAEASRVTLSYVAAWFLLALLMGPLIWVLCGWLHLVFLLATVPGPGSCEGSFFWKTGSTVVAFAWLLRLKHFSRLFQALAFQAPWSPLSPILQPPCFGWTDAPVVCCLWLLCL